MATNETGRVQCEVQVPDHTGYHFSRCDKAARWDVGHYGLRCGLHARGRWFEKVRTPLPVPEVKSVIQQRPPTK